MQTKNVIYAEHPERVMVYKNGGRARIEFPIDVEEIATEDRTEYLAKTVYSMETAATSGLKERVENNYEQWLAIAMIPEPQSTTLDDVIEAVNALTDMILEGGF